MKNDLISIIMLAIIAIIAYSLGLFSPSQSAAEEAEAAEMAAAEKLNPTGPTFNADSAYAFIAAQCAFGPRSMNTKSHDECGEWIAKKFESYGCKITNSVPSCAVMMVQCCEVATLLPVISPKQQHVCCSVLTGTRVLGPTTTPTAPIGASHIDGANDGASGVGVMLEIARLLQQNKDLAIGVDLFVLMPKTGARQNGAISRQ